MPSLTTAPTVLVAFVLGLICGFRLQSQGVDKVIPRSITILEKRPKPSEPRYAYCHKNTLRLVFTVMSSPDHNGVRKRSLIRGSWPLKKIYKNPPAVDIVVKFVVGTKDLPKQALLLLTMEQTAFADLVLLADHHDTYDQLTEKVRQTVLWADKNMQFDYLIKTDDDVVIRLDKFVSALRKLRCPKRLYWGRMKPGVPTSRTGKWKDMKWNFCQTYLPHASGTAYVLGRQVVQLLVRDSQHLSHFMSEDVSMGVWLSPYQLTRQKDWRFHMNPTCAKNAILAHQAGYGDDLHKLEQAVRAMLKTSTMC